MYDMPQKEPDRRFEFQSGGQHFLIQVRAVPVPISPELDSLYSDFFGQLVKTAKLTVQNNYAEGVDDIETPDELVQQLVMFRRTTYTIHEQQGVEVLNAFMQKSKAQLFQLSEFKKLNAGNITKLSQILHRHLQDGIENPPTLEPKRPQYKPKKK
jgi:hypothetical protein